MSFPYLSDAVQALTGYAVPLPLPTFGLLVALAMLVATYYLRQELARLHAAGAMGMARTRVKRADGARQDGWVAPQDVVPDLTVAVFVSGVLGARLFHILENLHQFQAHPWSMIFTRSGFSIFGGLILGTLVGLVCVRRWRLPIRPLLDAAAPAIMLGYAIGRIGCQVSGDGDWGIAANLALKPGWLPDWFWAQTYPNNIYGEVIALPGVYPTPMYETLMALLCFGLLWALRKHPFRSGWLFSIYLICAGVERLLVEQIRVNPVLDLLGIHATQAEFIAVSLIVLGVLGAVVLGRRPSAGAAPATPTLAGDLAEDLAS